ncbi:hypothetical protein PpBr36_04224 [Pyricularia pennisetigena]|uniref:hypothetical protein n=1 Tax=Pyricularia pennisetigena TaxID=1578925 RepID=UPI0011522FDC|nr:hypothetical protein PpBr36_04224 [Pyricularia pennisetigena]TLS26599.1 hypothetical protein PpBr36_04224 [Pyricularia pennisetigena]
MRFSNWIELALVAALSPVVLAQALDANNHKEASLAARSPPSPGHADEHDQSLKLSHRSWRKYSQSGNLEARDLEDATSHVIARSEKKDKEPLYEYFLQPGRSYHGSDMSDSDEEPPKKPRAKSTQTQQKKQQKPGSTWGFTWRKKDGDKRNKARGLDDGSAWNLLLAATRDALAGGWSSKTVGTWIRQFRNARYSSTVYSKQCKLCGWLERVTYWLMKWADVPVERSPHRKERGVPHESEFCKGCRRDWCQVGRRLITTGHLVISGAVASFDLGAMLKHVSVKLDDEMAVETLLA